MSDELRALHARYGAGGIGLTAEDVKGLPPGWSIVTRRWDRGCWDALIRPPMDGPVGWSLGGEFARTRRKAIKRAAAQISRYVEEGSAA